MMPVESVLLLDRVVAGYGNRRVLNGVSIEVGEKEIVALIGHNGAGKSTLLKCAFGLVRPQSGNVLVLGKSLKNAVPAEMLNMGVAYIPQGNRVFGELSVLENLRIATTVHSQSRRLSDDLERVFRQFPILAERSKERASILSGGEKQMLAFACALILKPRLLLIDEPSLGLGPKLVRSVLDQISEVRNLWSTAVLIVEQKVKEVLRIADRVYVLRGGSVSFSGPVSQLENEETLRTAYL